MAGGKRILIADDDPDLADLLESYFGGQGYQVEVVTNGKDAVQRLQEEKFDLALLDVMMPYMDGYHVANEVTGRLGQSAPKIIIMTSRDIASEKGIAFLSGASDTVQKPFALEEMDNKVKALLAARPE
ncbi:MAG: response regulator [Elusimicrobiales bacterium]|jgi:DNA-binding response OmpR family regulator|nr:response regulator [Elusimicrobiales bacterium]